MLDNQRFGNVGTNTAGLEQAGDHYNQMDEKKSRVRTNLTVYRARSQSQALDSA